MTFYFLYGNYNYYIIKHFEKNKNVVWEAPDKSMTMILTFFVL